MENRNARICTDVIICLTGNAFTRFNAMKAARISDLFLRAVIGFGCDFAFGAAPKPRRLNTLFVFELFRAWHNVLHRQVKPALCDFYFLQNYSGELKEFEEYFGKPQRRKSGC